ncbi:MAG: D-alanyl-D-alanine carboxypeptidase [Limibacillus sp.]
MVVRNLRAWGRMSLVGLAALLIGLSLGIRSAAALDTSAREAFVIDLSTDTVLLSKDADQVMPPASMSKIMTMYLVFERLKNGSLKLDDELPVSEKAWRMGGSKMFVEVGNRVRVEDLIRGIVIQSGNDACVVFAEAIAGSEEAFAAKMTEKARELGMETSQFANATGWPNPNHYMTARELAMLGAALIRDFPEYYHYFAELTASAERNGRRILVVVNGLESDRARAEEAGRLLEWAFREFESRELFTAGETVESVETWMGTADQVALTSNEDIRVTLPRSRSSDVTVKVTYEGPVQTPIEKGQHIADLRIEAEDMEPIVYPLVAADAVERQGPIGRFFTGITHMVLGSAGIN